MSHSDDTINLRHLSIGQQIFLSSLSFSKGGFTTRVWNALILLINKKVFTKYKNKVESVICWDLGYYHAIIWLASHLVIDRTV